MHSLKLVLCVVLGIVLAIKGTVSVSIISSDPPYKDGNARFITEILKPKFIQTSGRYF